MRKILEDFYYGNIMPYDKRICANSELRQIIQRAAKYEEQLTETLSEAERQLLDELTQAQRDIDSITAMENFVLGFRLGVRMMAECMDENDGNLSDRG